MFWGSAGTAEEGLAGEWWGESGIACSSYRQIINALTIRHQSVMSTKKPARRPVSGMPALLGGSRGGLLGRSRSRSGLVGGRSDTIGIGDGGVLAQVGEVALHDLL